MNQILQKMKILGMRQSFVPNIFSIFINPGLFIRWYLYKEIEKLAPQLSGKLLDFGCGRKPYKSLFTNVDEYIGLDIEVSGHPHTESDVDVYYDGVTIPFAENHFDSVFCSEVVEHIFNINDVLSEVNRVLKKNGTAIFTFPFAYPEHEKPYDFARYTSFGAKYIFEQNGFEVMQQIKTGHFLLVLIQLLITYVYTSFASKNKYLNTVLTLIFVTPLNLIGLLFLFFPNNKDLYFSNILFLKKVDE